MPKRSALVCLASLLFASEPPSDLIRRVAEREAANELERGNYTYRQTVTVHEFTERGQPGGEYREVREVIFSPAGERAEHFAQRPSNSLKLLRLTEEDFSDIRNIQPLLLVPEMIGRYDVVYRGEETTEGILCWVLRVRPRQILYEQRLFEGQVWVNQQDLSIIRMEGRAVPQKPSRAGQENLFPFFTTVREKFGDGFWFPVYTHAEDTLPFRTGPLRIRMVIRYRNYQRFSAESTITPQ